MSVHLRRGHAKDAAALGDICYRAFKAIAEAHGYISDFPSADVAAGALSSLLAHPRVFDLVAEIDGKPVGSNFLDERNPIAGVGPITIEPALQNDGAGTVLMQAVMRRSEERAFAGIRLVQAGFHTRSLALYLKLGFDVREPLVCLQGQAIREILPGYAVRPAKPQDLAECNALCARIHGHHRGGELADAITQGSARVVERTGRITGYATAIAFFAHAVGETTDDVKVLIGAAESFGGPGFLAPSRNGPLVRWCLDNGLRITQTMTLMSAGLYNHPEGAWLPSITY